MKQPRLNYFFLAVSIVVVACGFDASQALSQDRLADVIAKAEKSVVRIEVEGREGSSLGSGYIVHSSGIMVTHVHVMAGAQAKVLNNILMGLKADHANGFASTLPGITNPAIPE